MSDDPKEQLKEMIVERLFLTVGAAEIGDDEDFRDKFGFDSIQLFEIVIGLEEVFSISFEGDEDFTIEKFTTVNQILEVMKGKQGEQSGA